MSTSLVKLKTCVENKTALLSADLPSTEKDPVELAQAAAARIAKQLESRLAQKSEATDFIHW